MNRFGTIVLVAACGVVTVASILLVARWERPQTEQRGYRGLAVVQVNSPATLQAQDDINRFPKPLKRPTATSGTLASDAYENVQVLGDLTQAQFTRLMLSIKSWVAPQEGCDYCHAAPDYASDNKYAKRVARQMLKMVRHINADWKSHVGETGVVCYTCHRGHPQPPRFWYAVPAEDRDGAMVRKPAQRMPTPTARMTALPRDPLSDYLLNDKDIRIVGVDPLPNGNPHKLLETRDTYALMLIMSESLGVNCTYCHNTRAFYNWDISYAPRTKAWYGIRMVRDLNRTVLEPLLGTFPPERLGPTGDVPKIYCATCHLGTFKPLKGASLLPEFPELAGPGRSEDKPAAAPVANASATALPATPVVESPVTSK